MIVVFDTNIWKSALYFRSPMGSAVRHFLRKNGTVVGLPEVIELEVRRWVRADIGEAIVSITKSEDRLRSIMGKLNEVKLPSPEQIDQFVETVTDGFEPQLLRLPFDLEGARESFLRTVDKRVPSDKSQEFKDGLVWYACKKFLESDTVFLVTNDKAFFEDRDTTKGLADALKQEIAGGAHDFRISSELSSLLQEIRTPIGLEPLDLAVAYVRQFSSPLMSFLAKHGFDTIGPGENFEFKAYITEDPNKAIVEFEGRYAVSGRRVGHLTVKGEVSYFPDGKRLEDFRPSEETLSYVTDEGVPVAAKSAYLYADSLVLGSRVVMDRVRKPYDA